MKDLYILEPEVPGGLGPGTQITNQDEIEGGLEDIPKVENVEFVFDGWMGDDLVESYPVFLVTERLQQALIIRYPELVFEEIKVTTSQVFQDFAPDTSLPKFVRLLPIGQSISFHNEKKKADHEIYTDTKGRLVTSKEALEIFKRFNLNHCDIDPVS